MKRALIGAAAAIVIALGAATFVLRAILTRGLAPGAGTVRVPGLSAPVRVIRDRAGIPHIFANNTGDLMRALGYVQAQDRLFQIELKRRLAEGELAEVFGPDLVESDYVYRLLDPGRFARKSLALYPPAERAELDAFVDGINAYIDQHRDDLPLAFRILGLKPRYATALDLEAGALPIAMMLAYNLDGEAAYLNLAPRFPPETIAELFPVYPGLPLEPPPPQTTALLSGAKLAFHLQPGFAPIGRIGMAASNNWVIDGSKSASGRPMLANDPHLPQSLPSIWYEAVLVTPEGFVAGAMPVGSPAIAIGTNGHVAWGVTSVQADVMDLSIERLSGDGKDYLFKGKWYPLGRREETIHVKDRPDVVRAVRWTRHGPLVSDVLAAEDNPIGVTVAGNYALALRFAGLTPAPGALAGFHAALAHSGAELVESYRDFAITPLNLVWADEHDDIGWHVVGAIPNRIGFSGRYPTAGFDGEFEWKGMIPFDDLPSTQDPVEHFIVTANDRIANPPYSGEFVAPWRRDRIAALIQARPKLSIADFKAIQADRVSLFAIKLKEALLEAGDGGDPELTWALGELRSFDGQMTESSRAAALVAAAEVALASRLFKKRLGNDFAGFMTVQDDGGYPAIEDALMRRDSHLWPDGGPAETLRASLKDALAMLRQRLGNRAQWNWGRLHSISFEHPLGKGSRLLAWYFDRGPMPYGGGRHTINNGWFGLASPFATTGISSYRFIADMADSTHTFAINHTGESDNPASPHYDDMIAPWLAGGYHVLDAGLDAGGSAESAELDLLPVPSR